jgi:flagellar protein FliS
LTKSEINAYTMRVAQASKSELIVIMYEMAVKYIDDGTEALQAGNVQEFRVNIKRAKAVVNELASVLDLRFSVSSNLLALYTYMNNVMVKSDITLKTDDLIRVRAMLEKLHTAFGKVSEQDNTEPLMKNVQQVYSGLTYSRNSLNESYANASDLKRGYRV